MAGESGYEYRILAVLEATEGNPRPGFADLGWHRGRTPDDAIEEAVKKEGMPREDRGRCVAVASRWWIERDVRRRLEPHFDVLPISDGKPQGAGPVPEPSNGAGDDLDPRLDAEHPCEEDGCAHLPADHGSNGVGMCRVEGCPCGGYRPQPSGPIPAADPPEPDPS